MNKASQKRGPQFFVTVLFVAIGIFFSAHHASALTITPIRLELKANPGQIIKQEITLFNEKDISETLYVSYSNFEASGENGNPKYVDPKDDLGTWMNAAAKVVLAPKSSQIVPLIITVPKDATPGGHFAVVFWGTVPTIESTNQVSIGAKTGVLVLLSVSGAVNENGGIVEYNTINKASFFTSLPIGFYYRFQNNGGDRVKPAGSILIKNLLGITSARIPGNPVDGNVLPGSTRKIETVWQGKDGPTPVSDADQGNFFDKAGHEWNNFAFGHYKAIISLAYGEQNKVTTGTLGFWVFPWHLLLLIAAFLILCIMLLRKGLQHYNTWVIGRAEEMLRAEEKKSKLRKR